MTSEVVVMNSLGIALASDSAATVYIGGRAKLYQADKLFMLSHRHPVGAMIYNNSSLLGVPWETILKMYRHKLEARSFPTLKEYGDNLIAYLNNADRLFPAELQKQYYLRLLETIFRGIRKGIERSRDKEVRSGRKNGPDLVREIAASVIQKSLVEWRAKKDVTCFDPRVGSDLAGQLSGEVVVVRNTVFKDVKIEHAEASALQELAALVVSKDDIPHELLSGLVIAGFGEDEHLPVMQSFELGEIFLGKLKYRELPLQRIDSAQTSVVQPFAQSDMVNAFLNGISPVFEIKLMDELATLIMGLPEAVIDEVPRLSKATRKALKAKVLPQSVQVVRSLIAELEQHRVERHLDPILQSIAFLPKNELAHVAASLVNLNSFQKRMSIREDETVGGPIDVAVISKGDGFVWIERKHYFRPELNRHFFKNYGVQPETKEPAHDASVPAKPNGKDEA